MGLGLGEEAMWLAWIGAAAVLIYVLMAAGLFLFQRRILYLPDRARPDLARAGVAGAMETTVSTQDGLTLLAWYLPPAAPDGFVVLYLHGNAGHLGHRACRFAPFAALGWGVLMPEYRGFGGNPGSPSEAGLNLDAQAGLAALRAKGVPLSRILFWGESLGSGVAAQLATAHTPGAVLLEAPYTSIVAMARLHYPFVPVGTLLLDRFDSLTAVPKIRAPVLIMHGARDAIIPPRMGKALFDAATGPKEFWLAPLGGHADLTEAGAVEAAAAFVQRTVSASFEPRTGSAAFEPRTDSAAFEPRTVSAPFEPPTVTAAPASH